MEGICIGYTDFAPPALFVNNELVAKQNAQGIIQSPQSLAMIARVREVFTWHYSFTQVGAISNSRENDKTVFKVLWMIIFFSGLILSIFHLCLSCQSDIWSMQSSTITSQ